MGLSAAIAILVLELLKHKSAVIYVALFVVINSGYVWIRKDAQFEERAAPTTQLIAHLEELSPQSVLVTDFPLNPWIARMTTQLLPGWRHEQIVVGEPERCLECPELVWTPETQSYQRKR
jgi:hypothetical protein